MKSEGYCNKKEDCKIMQSAAKRLEFDLSVVRHLASVNHDFDAALLNDDMMSNMDKTELNINMADSKTVD